MVELTSSMILARTKFKTLHEVNKINFWGSQLANISIIRKMACLQIVSLSINEIDTLKDFSYCPNLEEIYIRRNKISDINEVYYLQNLKKLRVLWLHDNPCDSIENYRLVVLHILPNLKKLDNIEVTSDELDKSIAITDGIINIPSQSHLSTVMVRKVFQNSTENNQGNNNESSDSPNDSSPIINHNASEYYADCDNNFPLHNQDNLRASIVIGKENMNVNGHCNGTSFVDVVSSASDSEEKSSNDEFVQSITQPTNENLDISFQSMKPNNLLRATICLIEELDVDDLIIVSRAISQRIEKVQPNYLQS